MEILAFRYEAGGSYLVAAWLEPGPPIPIGALGRLDASGLLLYSGSARRGLWARLARHLRRSDGSLPVSNPGLFISHFARLGHTLDERREKRLHWHVDHLLESPRASVCWVAALPGSHVECGLVRRLLEREESWCPMEGFGSSDCPIDCPAHLVGWREPDTIRSALRDALSRLPVHLAVLLGPDAVEEIRPP